MKKHFLLILLSVFLICSTIIFAGCDNTPNNTDENGGGTTETPSGDNTNTGDTSKFSLTTNIENCTIEGDKINITVSNDTKSFSFINAFDIPENYKWELHYDKSCLPSLNVVSKSVDLDDGNNTLYALFVNKNDADDIYLYEILVHRCHIVTISYYDGDTLLYTEDTLSGQTFTPNYRPAFIGYDFDYWKTSNDKVFYNTLILSSISVYAQKIPEEYTITYNINGGQSLSNNTQKVKYGEKCELLEPKKDGCTFLGWYRDSIKFENSVWLYEENITLTAKWISGDAFYQNGQLFVYFGKYPQTYVSDENIINALNDIYTFNEDGYRVYNGEEYAAMYNYSSYDEYPSYPSLCYFKVEPILWRVVFEENNAYTLVSEYVLDNCYWGANETVSYYDSAIRKELNSTFYDSFFSDFEKSQILNTTIDNSENSTNGSYPNYSCSNSLDKMFLLSNLEVETYFTTASSRIAKATDYAKVNYVKTASSDGAYWVTRSPYASHINYSVSIYTAYGNLYWTMDNYTDSGVRPAIRVQG